MAGDRGVGRALRCEIVDALTDYFAAVSTGPNEAPDGSSRNSQWELGYDGGGGVWGVKFEQLLAAGQGDGELAVYTAFVDVDPALECLLTFHARFVLYKNGEVHAHYHYDPEWGPTAFDWEGPFTLIAHGGVLHVFERALYYEMYNSS